ncbi:MAG TPA: DUF4258 domain-containing protein [Candidatus Brocadiia bacterium]|nr:DUF4258 domain-containing protein [Candidatus Brocadiia bacterium]
MKFVKLVFTGHAIKRMFERYISPEEVRVVLTEGEIAETYEEDEPWPSRLVVGRAGNRILHVVAAIEPVSGICHVITTYEPDRESWTPDLKARRKR